MEKRVRKNNIHYYKLCFYHDEDDSLVTDQRCSYVIKTEIPPALADEAALDILFGANGSSMNQKLRKNLTCVMEIAACEAIGFFDLEDLTERVEGPYGAYYRRKTIQFPTTEKVNEIREEYPTGTRIELIQMEDAQAPPVGTKGTVRGVDDVGSLLVLWDNGSSLKVVYGVDIVRKI